MPRVTTRHLGHAVVLEVDGPLDVVTGHDLRRTLDDVLLTGPATVSMDLSRVTGVDDDGRTALARCAERAVATRTVLLWSSCSAPLVRDLRSAADGDS